MNTNTQPAHTDYTDYNALLRRVSLYDKEQVLCCALAIEQGVNRAGFMCGERSALEVVGALATYLAANNAFVRVAEVGGAP